MVGPVLARSPVRQTTIQALHSIHLGGFSHHDAALSRRHPDMQTTSTGAATTGAGAADTTVHLSPCEGVIPIRGTVQAGVTGRTTATLQHIELDGASGVGAGAVAAVAAAAVDVGIMAGGGAVGGAGP